MKIILTIYIGTGTPIMSDFDYEQEIQWLCLDGETCHHFTKLYKTTAKDVPCWDLV